MQARGGWRRLPSFARRTAGGGCLYMCIGDDCVFLDWGDEAVSAAGEGFDIAGARSGIPESFADLVYGGVEAVIEIDEGIGGPEFLADFFAGDDVAWALEEQGQDLKGLVLQAELRPVLAQLAGGQVKFEDAEADDSGTVCFRKIR